MTATRTHRREYWIDELKAFAMLSVVLEHSLMRTIDGLHLTAPGFFTVDNIFKAYYMPLFFLASGYVYALVERNRMDRVSAGTFIKKKAIDLLLPYIIFAIPIWLGKYIFSNWVTVKVEFSDLFMMFLNPIAFLWFIYILFFVQSIVYLLDKATNRNTLLVLLIVLGLNLARIFINTDIKLFDRILWYPLYYWLGVVFFEQKNKIKWENTIVISVIAIVALVLHLKLMNQTLDNVLFYRLANITISWAAASWFYLLRRNMNKRTAMAWIGSITLYIYVLHPIALDAIRVVLWKTGLKIVPLWILILFFGSLFCSCVYYWMAQKWLIFDLPFRPKRLIELKRWDKSNDNSKTDCRTVDDARKKKIG